ncbi:hypothetical protein [Gordonia sp. ABSL49_1]|uniref:hypothetical protein n=1 Tax=Gordonia sp. ABSL49_1 TaxID=2920941 RepID=UPI001F0E20E5|nr:hypothetical protein [Gordonia sp. ABSL49_1]MCH5641209.1 hypothetical protein [Gordonia sp. ABSL49_1]
MEYQVRTRVVLASFGAVVAIFLGLTQAVPNASAAPTSCKAWYASSVAYANCKKGGGQFRAAAKCRNVYGEYRAYGPWMKVGQRNPKNRAVIGTSYADCGFGFLRQYWVDKR